MTVEAKKKEVALTINEKHVLAKSLKAVIKKVPIPVAGLALGLAALGNLLQPYGEGLHTLLGALAACLILLLTAKLVMFPKMIRDDFSNSVLASVSATYLMTIMQLSGYLAPVWFEGAFGMWATAIVAHFVLMAWFTYSFLAGGRFKLAEVFPTYFICFVGVVVASIVSPVFGMETIGMGIFCFGFAAYAVLFVLVTYRYAKIETAEPTKPLFCIYTAPMSLSLVGYLAIAGEPNTGFVIAATVLAQMLFAVVMAKLPSLLRLKFYPSYAAMTFPFVITAAALGKSLAVLGVDAASPLFWLAGAETVLAVGMVLYVFGRYVGWLCGDVVREAMGSSEHGNSERVSAKAE